MILGASTSISVSTLSGVLGLIFFAVGGLATALALFKTQKTMATLALLRENNDALEQSVGILRRDVELYKADNAKKDAQLANQERRIRDLESMVSGTAAVEAMALRVHADHARILELLGDR